MFFIRGKNFSIKIKFYLTFFILLSSLFIFSSLIHKYRINQFISKIDEPLHKIEKYQYGTLKNLTSLMVGEFEYQSLVFNSALKANKVKFNPNKITQHETQNIILQFFKNKLDTFKIHFFMKTSGEIIGTVGVKNLGKYSNLLALHENLCNSSENSLKNLYEKILDKNIKSTIIDINEYKYFAVFIKITNDTYLVKITNLRFLYDSLKNFNNKTTVDSNIVLIKKTLKTKNYYILIVYILIMLTGFCVLNYITNKIINPLNKLKKVTEEISKGTFNHKIKINTKDEIEGLANSFNMMVDKLQKYISELSRTISEKKLLEAKIKLAAEIQLSALPDPQPKFNPSKNIDLSMCLYPCEEVSGDFYDYFFIDDVNLFFVIGDISGKGLSAALFMNATKLLIKYNAQQGFSPESILNNVNRTLCSDNQNCMFSTIFCGILNTNTGLLEFCNGGHTSPILYKNGKYEFIQAKENFLIGMTPDIIYEKESLTLHHDEMIILYSDGITDAQNFNAEFYSEKRLLETLNKIPPEKSSQIIEILPNSIKEFSRNTEQYDDYTLIVLKRL